MATTPAIPTEAPSFSDLRAMISAPVSEPAEETPAKTETPASPVADRPAEAQHTEAEPGPAHIQEPKEPVEEKEEPLPENVQKKIAREVERTARIQRDIDHAISERKAKEAELTKLKTSDTGKPGSEPAPNTEPAKGSKPIKPKFEDFNAEGKTYADYQAALEKYEGEHETWLLSESERKAEERWKERQAKESSEKAIAEAVKAHGEGWNEARERVAQGTPEGLQTAISAMGDWSALVAHLGKPENAAELKGLADRFAQNPYAAVAELGVLQNRLKTPAPKPEPAAPAEILPKPPSKIGGSSSVDGGAVNLSDGRLSFTKFKSEVKRLTAKTG